MLLQYFGKKKKAAHSLYNAITIEITSEVVSNRTSSLQFERVLAFKLVRDRRRILRDNCEIVDISGDIFVVVSPITHPDISFGHGCSESHFGEDIRESLPPSCPAGSQAKRTIFVSVTPPNSECTIGRWTFQPVGPRAFLRLTTKGDRIQRSNPVVHTSSEGVSDSALPVLFVVFSKRGAPETDEGQAMWCIVVTGGQCHFFNAFGNQRSLAPAINYFFRMDKIYNSSRA